jgi:hypothetical protein
MKALNLRTFCETIERHWVKDKSVPSQDSDIDPIGCHRRLRSRDIHSGHWLLKKKTLSHQRPSTVLYTQPAADYEPTGTNITQSTVGYHNLDQIKKNYIVPIKNLFVMYPGNIHPMILFYLRPFARNSRRLQRATTSKHITLYVDWKCFIAFIWTLLTKDCRPAWNSLASR